MGKAPMNIDQIMQRTAATSHRGSAGLPPEKQEISNMQTEVQWLAERLLKARIKANHPAFVTWLATAYWCTQLARLSVDPSSLICIDKRKKKHQRLHLFEKIKALEVCKLTTQSTSTVELWERKEKEKGEPGGGRGASS